VPTTDEVLRADLVLSERLYDDGYQAGERFLAGREWQEYLRRHRTSVGRPT
jgi:hypothetical protein